MSLVEARMIADAASEADLAAPGGELVAAMEVLRSHPAEWERFQQQRRCDAVIAAALATVAPPPGLRAEILAAQATQERVHPRRRFLLAWAAGLVGLAGGGLAARWILGGRVEPAGAAETLAAAAARFLDAEWDHVFEDSSASLDGLQRHLAANGQPGIMEPGDGFEGLTTLGCRRFGWRGQVAVLVCFRSRDGSTVVHVVSVPRETLAAPEGGVTFLREGRWHGAFWQRGARAYVALSDQPLDRGQWGRG